MRRFVRLVHVGAFASVTSVGACGVDETVLRQLSESPGRGPGDASSDIHLIPDVVANSPSDVFTLTLGAEFTCALLRGVAFCWGSNLSGALGTGDGQKQLVPTSVKGGRLFDMLAAGDQHVCGLERETGTVFCWGDGTQGQLGRGDKTTLYEPMAVPLPSKARTVGVGQFHSCAILETGALYCWGMNGENEIGIGDSGVEVTSPMRVGDGADWIAISGGQGHTCGLRQAPRGGTLWCWGRNNSGQVGVGPSPPSPEQLLVPTQVGTLDDWKSVDLGQGTACGTAADGSLRCWGFGGDSLLDGTRNPVYEPTTIGSDRDWATVSNGALSTCGVTMGHQIRCWGRNMEGQLGLGDTAERPTPTPLAGTWSLVGVGSFHMCAMKLDHTIACTGENDKFQLGLKDDVRRNLLTPVDLPVPALQ